MNPAVALLIASLSCADSAMTFRDFYARFYQSPRGEFPISEVLRYYADAQADWLEYRVARIEKCGGQR